MFGQVMSPLKENHIVDTILYHNESFLVYFKDSFLQSLLKIRFKCNTIILLTSLNDSITFFAGLSTTKICIRNMFIKNKDLYKEHVYKEQRFV